VVLNGRVSSLLEVGTGFHKELTGRENVYLNGTILGMRKAEVDAKFDEIVAFSGVEKFIDTPVKRYSSGMRVRLAFSVAAHLEPEILLVDEVLAVGDVAFQRKCLGKMGSVASEGRTVIFVSHNMATISSLCPKAMLLEKGRLRKYDNTDDVVGQYLSSANSSTLQSLKDRRDRTGSGRLRFVGMGFVDRDLSMETDNTVASGHQVDIVLDYQSDENRLLSDVMVAVVFSDKFGNRLFTCSTEFTQGFKRLPSSGRLICQIGRFPLSPGDYTLLLWSSVKGKQADRIENAGTCHVESGDFFGSGKLPNRRKHGSLLVEHEWRLVEFDKTSPSADTATS